MMQLRRQALQMEVVQIQQKLLQMAMTERQPEEQIQQRRTGATAPTVAEKFEEVKSAADKMSNEEAVAYYLKKHPELKGIFALNETSTQLGIQVLDELDNSDEIQIVGFEQEKNR